MRERLLEYVKRLDGDGELFSVRELDNGDLRVLVDFGLGGIKVYVVADIDLPEVEPEPTPEPKPKTTRKRSSKTKTD